MGPTGDDAKRSDPSEARDPHGPHGLPGPLAALEGLAFEAVLFDLDGTLIDSTDAVLAAWAQWARAHGLASPPAVAHGVPARQMLATIVTADEIEPAFRMLEALEVAQLDGIVVLPGAAEALRALPPDRMAVVTSGTPPLVRARLGATGLPSPPLVITADDVPVGKPHPDPYLLAAQRLGVDPAACLVVEDAPAGLTAARAAGCRSLAVTTSHPANELDADAVVGTLADVRLVVGPGGGPAPIRVLPALTPSPDGVSRPSGDGAGGVPR